MIGSGKIDFMTSRLDLRVASLPHSTGFFALDIPLEITGTLARPSARPAVGSAAEMPDRMPALSADLRAVSDRNSCAR
jgi:AsmA family protein